MTPKQVNAKMLRIRAKISKHVNELHVLWNECTHPNATHTACSNAGGYDNTNDQYWYEFDCPDCGKRWSEDQ